MWSLRRVTSAGDSKVFLPSGAARAFPAVRSAVVDPVKHPWAQALDLLQAPQYAPSPLCLPLVKHVKNQSRTSAAAGVAGAAGAAQGVVMSAISSCVSRRSTVSPGRHETGRSRELMVVEDVLLKSTFPVLLTAGASRGPPPLDWWPTQTNRQGDGGPLGPHVVERGVQINRRR